MKNKRIKIKIYVNNVQLVFLRKHKDVPIVINIISNGILYANVISNDLTINDQCSSDVVSMLYDNFTMLIIKCSIMKLYEVSEC